MSDLTTYKQRPETMIGSAIAALLDPTKGVTIDELGLSIDIPGTVTITPTATAYAQSNWMYYGHATAVYQRIDFSTLLGTFELRMMVSFPATTMDIVNILNAMFDLAITSDDVVNEIIPSLLQSGMTYYVKANPNSTMWTGKRAVKLYPVTLPPGA